MLDMQIESYRLTDTQKDALFSVFSEKLVRFSGDTVASGAPIGSYTEIDKKTLLDEVHKILPDLKDRLASCNFRQQVFVIENLPFVDTDTRSHLIQSGAIKAFETPRQIVFDAHNTDTADLSGQYVVTHIGLAVSSLLDAKLAEVVNVIPDKKATFSYARFLHQHVDEVGEMMEDYTLLGIIEGDGKEGTHIINVEDDICASFSDEEWGILCSKEHFQKPPGDIFDKKTHNRTLMLDKIQATSDAGSKVKEKLEQIITEKAAL